MNSYFQFYSNIFIFKGVNRSILFDTQFKNYYFISNFVFNEINKNIINIEKTKPENSLVLNKWLDYFIENNLGFYSKNPDYFPQINPDYYFEGIVSNMIIEISEQNHNEINSKSFITQIELLGTKGLVLICEKPVIINFLKFLHYFEESSIEHIEIYLSGNYFSNEFIENISTNIRIKKITFLNSIEKPIKLNNNNLVIEFSKNTYANKLCGSVFIHNNFINLKQITESINHNSCLHKKISIDIDGNIKNCPSMPQIFGNIKETPLEEALNHPDFKKYWNITKDRIEVCKDCEFRHICTDCRAYTERNHFDGDIDLSKPLKCGYNPYTNEWAEWSTNPLKEKAIEFYGMQHLVKTNN